MARWGPRQSRHPGRDLCPGAWRASPALRGRPAGRPAVGRQRLRDRGCALCSRGPSTGRGPAADGGAGECEKGIHEYTHTQASARRWPRTSSASTSRTSCPSSPSAAPTARSLSAPPPAPPSRHPPAAPAAQRLTAAGEDWGSGLTGGGVQPDRFHFDVETNGALDAVRPPPPSPPHLTPTLSGTSVAAVGGATDGFGPRGPDGPHRPTPSPGASIDDPAPGPQPARGCAGRRCPAVPGRGCSCAAR